MTDRKRFGFVNDRLACRRGREPMRAFSLREVEGEQGAGQDVDPIVLAEKARHEEGWPSPSGYLTRIGMAFAIYI
jgi:hypothetical protein